MARRTDPRQVTLFEALDAAGPHIVEPAWWFDTWRDGDPVPPGWHPPHPDAEIRKPRRPEIDDQPFDDGIMAEVDRALQDVWCPGRPLPFTAFHETVRHEHSDSVVCGVEAFDGGLAHVLLIRDPSGPRLCFLFVPGASAAECPSGLAWDQAAEAWRRLPAEWAWDDARRRYLPRPKVRAA